MREVGSEAVSASVPTLGHRRAVLSLLLFAAALFFPIAAPAQEDPPRQPRGRQAAPPSAGPIRKLHQSPSTCSQNALSLDITRIPADPTVPNGSVVNYTIHADNLPPATACDATNVTITFRCPAADGTPTGPLTTLTTGDAFLSGSTETFGPVPCTINVNPGVTSATARADFSGTIHTAPVDDTATGFKTITVVLEQPPATATFTPSNTRTPTRTRTRTNTRTRTATRTVTPTPSDTPIATATFTPSDTPTASPTSTPIPSDTPTAVASNTPTSTPSSTPTAPEGPTNTPTVTPILDLSATPTVTPVGGEAPTATASPTVTATAPPTVTPTQTAVGSGPGGPPGGLVEIPTLSLPMLALLAAALAAAGLLLQRRS